jgi:DNA-directed RNA polymerases I, II, and III subunit RPABC1
MSDENFQTYNAYKTVCNMLYNRGHVKLEVDPFELFLKKSKAELTINSICRDDYPIKTEPVNVYFPEEDKVGVKPIRLYLNDMNEHEIKHAILVIKDCITPFARSEIEKIQRENLVIVEVFTEKELLFDITEHELVPKHELLCDAEKEQLLKDFSLKEAQLPRILITDPICRYYGLQKRDIVKITRPSETGGKYINYRIVV